MAMLRNLKTHALLPLPGRLLIGRSSSALLQLDGRHVSGEHATLQWRKAHWELRDLGSRNGTFIDGERLPPGEARVLAAGAKLTFGGEEEQWELVDIGAPSAVGRNSEGTWVLAADGILSLPSPEAPEVQVFADSRGRWQLESGDQVQPVMDGQLVTIGEDTWAVLLPKSLEGTATVDLGPTLDTIRLRLAVSRDEEHVQATVLFRGAETPIDIREHWYAVLTLARARVAEAEEPLSEQGWMDRDQLLKMLGTDGNGMNVAFYRARGQLSRAGVDGAAGLIEVRRGQRRIGLEPDRIEITSL